MRRECVVVSVVLHVCDASLMTSLIPMCTQEIDTMGNKCMLTNVWVEKCSVSLPLCAPLWQIIVFVTAMSFLWYCTALPRDHLSIKRCASPTPQLAIQCVENTLPNSHQREGAFINTIGDILLMVFFEFDLIHMTG